MSNEIIQRPGFTARVVESTPVFVVLDGALREPTPEEWFLPFLEQAHSLARSRKDGLLVIDIQALGYLNASGFRVIVAFLHSVKKHQDAFILRFLANPRHSWQQVAMSGLLAAGGKNVQVENR